MRCPKAHFEDNLGEIVKPMTMIAIPDTNLHAICHNGDTKNCTIEKKRNQYVGLIIYLFLQMIIL